MENFDESMVLLKELLCWDFEDLSSLKLNVHAENSKSKVSEEGKGKLKEWLSSDFLLYEHFKAKFKAKLSAYGSEKMAQEVELLRAWNKRAEERCPLKYVAKGRLPRNERPWGNGVLGYKMLTNDPDCQLMAMQELRFIDLVRETQKKKALKLMHE